MNSACDTSVLVPALVAWHPDHEAARAALSELEALPTHVLMESFSVLTRLPAPHRISAVDAAALLRAIEVPTVGLPPREHARLISEFPRHGIRGGAVYDALVAATARHHQLALVSRDLRARSTYEAMGVRYRFVG